MEDFSIGPLFEDCPKVISKKSFPLVSPTDSKQIILGAKILDDNILVMYIKYIYIYICLYSVGTFGFKLAHLNKLFEFEGNPKGNEAKEIFEDYYYIWDAGANFLQTPIISVDCKRYKIGEESEMYLILGHECSKLSLFSLGKNSFIWLEGIELPEDHLPVCIRSSGLESSPHIYIGTSHGYIIILNLNSLSLEAEILLVTKGEIVSEIENDVSYSPITDICICAKNEWLCCCLRGIICEYFLPSFSLVKVYPYFSSPECEHPGQPASVIYQFSANTIWVAGSEPYILGFNRNLGLQTHLRTLDSVFGVVRLINYFGGDPHKSLIACAASNNCQLILNGHISLGLLYD